MKNKYVFSLFLLVSGFFLINLSMLGLQLYADVPFFEGLNLYFKRHSLNSYTAFFHIAVVLLAFSVKIGFSRKSDSRLREKFYGISSIAIITTILGFILGKGKTFNFNLFNKDLSINLNLWILSSLLIVFWIVFYLLLRQGYFSIDKFRLKMKAREEAKRQAIEEERALRRQRVEEANEAQKDKEVVSIIDLNEDSRPGVEEEEDEIPEYDEIVDAADADDSEPVLKEVSQESQSNSNNESKSQPVQSSTSQPSSTQSNIPTQPQPLRQQTRIVRVVEEEDELDLEHGVAKLEGQTKARKVWNYNKPGSDMLIDHQSKYPPATEEELNEMQAQLIEALKSFSISAESDGFIQGPTVTLFKVSLATGVKVSKVESASKDIARYLGVSASAIRVLPTIPGTHDIGIEVPNKSRQTISFKKLSYALSATNMQLPFALGASVTGETVCIDLAKTPHLLVAGATGSGKSVCINTLIASLLFTKSPTDVRFIMVDPKVVELQIYNDIPHLLTEVITEPKRAIMALDFCVEEMERRYRMLEPLKVRNIVGYNAKLVEQKLNREKMPYIVVIIDEFADLMMVVGKDLEARVARLAAKARAVGIHIVLATQRPSVDVITGTIKNNLPTRIGFRVPSNVDSKTILDCIGAERLLGNGDMLYKASDAQDTMRLQGGFISDGEVDKIVEYARLQDKPMYIKESFFENEIEADEEFADDAPIDPIGDARARWSERDEQLLRAAWDICVQNSGVSTSYIQRTLRVGYNVAARIVDEMSARGIAGPSTGSSKPRALLKYPE